MFLTIIQNQIFCSKFIFRLNKCIIPCQYIRIPLQIKLQYLMGGKSSKSHSFGFGRKNIANKNHLETDIICPGCNLIFPKHSSFQEVKAHMRMCLQIQDNQNGEQSPVKDFIEGTDQANKMKQVVLHDYIYQKIPQNAQKTKFRWQKRPNAYINHHIIVNMTPQQVKNLSFQQKNYWFRYQIQKKRINWMSGADFMKIQRTNVLMSSLVQYSKVNMYKEVKIQFIGDKVNDAGGLLREWIHMVVKQIFDQQTGIMSISNTDEIMYKLKWDQQLDEQFSVELFTLFGVILGKSVFQKIPIISYIDRTILRQITGRPLDLSDIYGFDKGLYQSWKFMLDNQINEMGLQTYFTVHKQSQQSTVKQIQLIQNGKQIQVTDANKHLYIESCMEHLCTEAVKRSLNSLKNGFYKVIPQNLISIFQPYEMEMILYGVPYIDVRDWKQNSQYKGEFHPKHKVIEWFWGYVQGFDQQKLANLLHFCTGSSRTPIQGFKKMQSNRGNVGKFVIESSKFDKGNPFPKGHTCFNRLQLPLYPNKQLLETYVDAISKQHLDGVFGLD